MEIRIQRFLSRNWRALELKLYLIGAAYPTICSWVKNLSRMAKPYDFERFRYIFPEML
jgi:hypothetical protein